VQAYPLYSAGNGESWQRALNAKLLH